MYHITVNAVPHLLDNVGKYLQEFYGDFIAVSPHLMSLNVVGCCEVSKLLIIAMITIK